LALEVQKNLERTAVNILVMISYPAYAVAPMALRSLQVSARLLTHGRAWMVKSEKVARDRRDTFLLLPDIGRTSSVAQNGIAREAAVLWFWLPKSRDKDDSNRLLPQRYIKPLFPQRK
jgi:hypothetical protein